MFSLFKIVTLLTTPLVFCLVDISLHSIYIHNLSVKVGWLQLSVSIKFPSTRETELIESVVVHGKTDIVDLSVYRSVLVI